MCDIKSQVKYIPIKDIDVTNRNFCISYPLDSEKLIDSVKKIGIINPIIVKDKKPYTVISGFKRLNAALKIGIDKVPCLIKDVKDEESCLIAIHENLIRELNLVEKANSISMLSAFGFSLPEIYEIMKLLGLGTHENIIKKMQLIANSEKLLKDYIVTRQISMKNIDYLLWFEIDDREKLLKILNKLHITESLLREILQMLILTKLKTDTLPFEALSTMDNPYEIKKFLKKLTNPIITKLEDKFNTLKHNLKLPKNVEIKVDPFFEKEYIDVLIKVKDKKELEYSLSSLSNLLTSKKMEEIFGLTKNRIH